MVFRGRWPTETERDRFIEAGLTDAWDILHNGMRVPPSLEVFMQAYEDSEYINMDDFALSFCKQSHQSGWPKGR